MIRVSQVQILPPAPTKAPQAAGFGAEEDHLCERDRARVSTKWEHEPQGRVTLRSGFPARHGPSKGAPPPS
jgi:hypothetical protein